MHANFHDILLLKNFLKLKCDHRFRCPFDRQAYMHTFTMLWSILTPFNPNPSENRMMEFHFWPNSQNLNLIIYLDACLIYQCAHQLLQCSELFGPPSSLTLEKMHDGVSLLTNFSELKFDHRFRCPFYIQACTPTFVFFWAIWTPFKDKSNEKCTMEFHF